MVKMSRVGYWLTVVFLSSGLFCLGCGHKATTPTNQIQQVFETGDWEATVALCDQTLQEHPNNVEALTFRGRAYVADGQYFKGIEDFTTVVELQPDDAEGYYHREIAYRLAGKTEQADVDGQRGRELDTLYKSAYAYEPSSFRSISTSSSNPYVEPIYADEASFQANDPTSRLLAADTSTEPAENETLESRVGQDVVIPQVPKVDRTNGIPKLKGTETAKTDEADAPKDAAEVEEIEGIQFPPQPLADTPNDSDLPNIDNPFVNPPPPISTSLPIGPAGNLFIPGAPLRGVVGTGLPTARTSGGATGTSSLRPQGLSFGRSGLPIPNNTTGLPMSSPLTMGQLVQPLIPPGQQTQFHANPIFAPGQSPPPQVSNVVPDFRSSNPFLIQPVSPSATAVPTAISTALPDTVLENKLAPARPSKPAAPSYRSIQP